MNKHIHKNFREQDKNKTESSIPYELGIPALSVNQIKTLLT